MYNSFLRRYMINYIFFKQIYGYKIHIYLDNPISIDKLQ